MSFDADTLYKLLPEIHRLRDAERDEPLRALLGVIADQVALLEENLAQLHDDQFVETSAPWTLPYIADLLGVTGLPSTGIEGPNARAEVANTIAYRRRKGTVAVLEQLARDATGWPARAVEFFQLVATTQHLNHLRPENTSFIGVRDASRLEYLGTAFERLARRTDLPHSVDVRRIPPRDGARVAPLTPPGGVLDPALDALPLAGVGRYGIPNVGLFLFRLRAQPLTRVEASKVDARCFRFDPLGADVALFNNARTERELTHLAEPANVPGRISRRELHRDLTAAGSDADGYYGRSLKIETMTPGDEPALIDRTKVVACDLSDWSREPPLDKTVAVDPALGRIKFRTAPTASVLVSYHLGVTANLGGGEYTRSTAASPGARTVIRVSKTGPIHTLQDALNALPQAGGVIEIDDSARYEENLTVPSFPSLEIRAADKRRPTLVILGGPLILRGAKDGEITLSGLLIAGRAVQCDDPIRLLRIEHTTLLPGIALGADGKPTSPGAPSLTVFGANTELVLDHAIVGGLRVVDEAKATITASIVDASSGSAVAYAAPGDNGPKGPGGSLRVVSSTLIGKIHAAAIELVSNSILLAYREPNESNDPNDPNNPWPWLEPVRVRRRQEGCVRFSYVPPGSRVPRRAHCQPASEADAARVRPMLDSTRYGDPEYGRLSLKCPDEIRRGADDGSEMGVFHELYQPQREDHLRVRLDEYLRFGLEAGIVYAT
ncbi:hypothetical protein [Sorangium sp. So ce145]|uniref:hypothetical protein n=1 Tax=Sorangium sp. So ce145 TaxID=3133285 RepID=UPI003F63810B